MTLGRVAITLALVTISLPAGAWSQRMDARVRESAARMANECVAGERHAEFVDRFHGAVMATVAPTMEDYQEKIRRSVVASDNARAAYIGCIQRARAEDRAPKEACSAENEHFLERESTLRSLRSKETYQQFASRTVRPFYLEIKKMSADFPDCDFAKLLRMRPTQ